MFLEGVINKPLFLFMVLLANVSGGSWGKSATTSWIDWAKRFTGESDLVRRQAIHQLKVIPNLESILKEELKGEYKFLALDVIGTLRLHQLRSDLMTKAGSDSSGMFFVTLNSLITNENKDSMVNFYLVQFRRASTSPASKVVILDTLSRLHVPMDKDLLAQALDKDSTPEVKGAVLKHLQTSLTSKKSLELLPLLEKALSDDIYQIRIQALFVAAELPNSEKKIFLGALKNCAKDPEKEVRQVCKELNERSHQ